MAPFFWLDLSLLSLALVLASALAFTVLVAWKNQALHATFAAFILMTCTWATSSILLRMALWLEIGAPDLLSQIAVYSFALTGPSILVFSAVQSRVPGRIHYIAAGAALLLTLVIAYPMFTGAIVQGAQLADNGCTIIYTTRLGVVAALVPGICFIWSLVLLWRRRRQAGETQLGIGVLLFFLGMVLDGLFAIKLPLVSLFAAGALGILGYGTVRTQILNPLRDVTADLGNQVQQRTRELSRAYGEIEEKINERTHELRREVTERVKAEASLRERAARLELLATVARDTTANLDLEDSLLRTVDLISRVFKYHNVTILLAEGDTIVIKAASMPEVGKLIGIGRLKTGAEGITGWVAAKGEPLLVPDVDKDSRYLPVLAGIDTKSELAVPIRLQSNILGVLDAQSARVDDFTDDDVFTLQTIADQLAITIENARLYRESRVRAERLSVVNRVARAAGATLQLDDLLEIVHSEISAIFSADALFVALYDEENDELDYRIQVDEGTRVPPTRRSAATGLSSRVLAEKKAILVTEFSSKDGTDEGPDLWGSMRVPSAWLGVPMRLGQRLVGVISIQTYGDRPYSTGEQLLLSTIADQVAIAVENARLYGEVEADLEARKRTEEILRESEEKFRNLAEESPNMIFINANGKVVFANKKCSELTGYTQDEFYSPGFDFRTLVAPEYREHVEEAFRNHMSGEEVSPYEYDILTKTGRRLQTIITVKLIAYAGELAILGIITDITDRKLRESLLRSLNSVAVSVQQAITIEEVFSRVGKELANLLLNCFIYQTADGPRRLRLAYISHGPERLVLTDRPEYVESTDPVVEIEDSSIYAKILSDGESVITSAKDTASRVIPEAWGTLASDVAAETSTDTTILAPLALENEAIGILGVQSPVLTKADIPTITAFANQVAAAIRKASLMQDLSESLDELKRTQEQLVHSQKMEAVGQLAGGIAHDFNNLLTAITGYTDLLLIDPQIGESARSELGEIQNTVRRAADLINQLLAFSRKQVLEPRALDLNAAILHLRDMLQRIIGEDIDLTTDPCKEVSTVMADPGQIEQVIINLAVNAREAMPSGGSLVIRTAVLSSRDPLMRGCTDLGVGPYVMLEVSDDGEGMAPETLQHLFEPFFTTKKTGTGLGLATAHGIVSQSGGHICVESHQGSGSTFRVFLPREADVRVETETLTKPTVRPSPGSGRILAVEDEEMLRNIVTRVLQESGYEVLSAGNAVEALRVSRSDTGHIDLLLTDVVMPGGMNGKELAEILVSERPKISVLFMSGYADSSIVQHGIFESGASFLKKPFDAKTLVGTVREALGHAEIRES